MKSSAFFRIIALGAVLTGSLTACNTGTEAGDTNVERGSQKDKDPSANMPNDQVNGDSTTSGLNQNEKQGPTGREVYEDAADRKDKNNDGLAD